jgi:hypothetical protein
MKLSHLSSTFFFLRENDLLGLFPGVGLVGEVAVSGGRQVDWSSEAEFLDYTMLDKFLERMEELWLKGD